MNGLSNAILALITLWSLPNLSLTSPHSYTWQMDLQQDIHSVVTEFAGPTTIEEWDKPFIQVETLVWENTGSDYSLEYCEKKGYFRLETRYELAGTQLVIASRKINTLIFVKGKEARTRKQYKVYLPRYLNYEVALPK